MMRKFITIVIMTVALMTLGGCQNDGHIGWLFGVWRVAEYTVDGIPQDNALIGTTTIAFQNNVVEVVALTDDYYSTYERFGSWEENGSTLTLDFTHSDDAQAPGTGSYAAPAWLGMTSSAPMVMTVSDRKGDGFTLTWETPQGITNVYKLRKTW